jgi:lia operon protein LiaG
MSRRSIKILTLLLTIIMVGSFSAAAVILVKSRNLSIVKQNVDQEMLFSYMSRIKDIYLKTSDADIRIRKTKEVSLRARLRGRITGSQPDEMPRMEIREEEGQLNIEVKKPYSFPTGPSSQTTDGYLMLEIDIPDTYIGNLKVRTTSGDLVLGPMHVNNLQLHTDSGDIQSQKLIAFNTMSIRTASGAIQSQDLRAQSIEIRTQSGDVELQLVAAEDTARIQSVSGDVDIEKLTANQLIYQTTSGDLKGKRFFTQATDLNAISGNIKIEHMAGNLDFMMDSGDISVMYNPLDGNIQGKTSSGKVEISLSPDAEFEIKARTTSGTILCPFSVERKGKEDPKRLNGIVGDPDYRLKIDTISGDIYLWK